MTVFFTANLRYTFEYLEYLPSHRSHSMQQVVYGICVTTHTGHQQTRDHHVHTVKANHLGHVQTTQWTSQIAKALTSTSIRHRSMSNRCLIHGNLMAFAIWEWTQNTNWKRRKLLVTNNFPLFQFVFFFFCWAHSHFTSNCSTTNPSHQTPTLFLPHLFSFMQNFAAIIIVAITTISNAHYIRWSSLDPLIWPQGWVQMGL